MIRKELKNEIIERVKVELNWNEFEMNLFIISNILENLTFFNIPQYEDIQKNIQSLIDDIYIILGLNCISGDLVNTSYVLTYEQ